MDPREFASIAGRLMRQPAAPLHERLVQQEVARLCREYDLPLKIDRFGNCIVRLRSGRRGRPIALSAHMDHPGFTIQRQTEPSSWIAQFQGGVSDSYFRAGVRVRLMPGALRAKLAGGITKDKKVRIEAERGQAARRPEFAVWDLRDFTIQRGRILGRACDDLVGAAAVLATLIDLKRARARCNVTGILSRAEEIGFLGALALADDLPGESLVISLETSREIPPVKMGSGVIVRVGDRSSIFDSEATRFLSEVAGELLTNDKTFCWQRALMSGGTCEGTAYQEMGFKTAAVCVALGNYHNCAEGGAIKEEFVDLADACGMVRLLVEAAKQMPNYKRLTGKLPARIRGLHAEARRRLVTPIRRRSK